MRHYNIDDNEEHGLGQFTDERGIIKDIFYSTDINHACLITNAPNAVRGNHYHKLTTQYTYVLTGTLYYYSKPYGSKKPAECYVASKGDVIISEPNEVHAMQAGDTGCTFIAFAAGPRGGKDYESDTYKLKNSIVPGEDDARRIIR
jgi:quercetin dioxygenase-like cupin family protein